MLKGMRSSTIWTTGWNTSKKALCFHTQHNRRVRSCPLRLLQPEPDPSLREYYRQMKLLACAGGLVYIVIYK
jgi:hypothetical protein